MLRGGQTSRYVVDSVLGEAASQQQTYETLVAPLVDSFIQVCAAMMLLIVQKACRRCSKPPTLHTWASKCSSMLTMMQQLLNCCNAMQCSAVQPKQVFYNNSSVAYVSAAVADNSSCL